MPVAARGRRRDRDAFVTEKPVRDPYEVLGLARTASAEEIRSAYRKLAKTLHPDLNPGDKAAEDRFKEVAGAYDLLGDAEKRRRFDAGEIDASGAEKPPQQQRYYRDFAASEEGSPYADASGFADFMDEEDAFAELLRRSQRARANRRGQDLRYQLAIDFADSIAGGVKRLTLPDGGTIEVTIPAGLVDGQTLRLKGKGAPGAGSGQPGDALITVEVRPDPRFTRSGDDIAIEIPVSLTQAVLGGEVRVPTPTGAVTMTVPKGANSGTRLRLRGKGAPRREGGSGDQFVTLRIVLPKPPDPDLEAFVAGWAGRDYDPNGEKAS